MILLIKKSAASVPNAKPGKAVLFVDTDGAWKSKDEAGLVTVISGVVAPTLQSVTSTATFTPAASDDVCVISAQAAALTIAAPAGTSDGRRTIVFKIKDNGTTRAITWNAAYVWIGTAYANTTAGKWAYVTAIYNAMDSKWHLMAAQVQP